MLEDGKEWTAHCRTRLHRRLLRGAPEPAKLHYESLLPNDDGFGNISFHDKSENEASFTT